MSPHDREPWAEVKRLFGQAVELEPERRRAFLDRVTAGNPALRSRVEELLAADDEAEGFLEDAGADVDLGAGPAAGGWIGRRFGPYEVVGELGRGGTGVVLLGARADGRYEGHVALKVVPAALVQGQLQARFRSEIRILAELDHPNVARLLDAGETPEGLAYLVMERVDGPRIDVFANERSLNIRERLELFRAVLDGVAYAHAHNVIHRDLKPSNILVTGKGVPKLVDFGIAKLLGGAEGVTLTGGRMRMMTPEYASPEQVRGDDVGARTDVYSLGVVLYRLLTGRAPYLVDPTEPRSAERVICEETPTRPSTAVGTGSRARELKGDLDAIVLHALAKEPEERYPTARAFSADVARYLEGRPIQARRPGLSYRVTRFVRRHRTASVLGAAAVVILSALGWQVYEARVQRRAAEASSHQLTELVNSVITTLNTDVAAEDAGPTARREAAVAAALASLQALADRAPGRPTPTLLTALAKAYQEIGTLQGHPLSPNLGDAEAAAASLTRSIELWSQAVDATAGAESARLSLAGARVLLSDIYRFGKHDADTDELLRLARATVDSLSSERPPNLALLQRRGMVYERLSWRAEAAGDFDAGAAYVGELARATDGMVALTPEGPSRLNTLQTEATTLQQQAILQDKAAHFDEAIAIQRRAVHLADSLASLPGATQRMRGIQAETHSQLGWRFNDADRPDDAEPWFTSALEINAAIHDEDRKNVSAAFARGIFLNGRGQARIRAERWAAAVSDARESVGTLTPMLAAFPVTAYVMIQDHRQLGEAYTRLGRYDEATREYETSIAMGDSLFATDTTNAFSRMVLALSHLSHALHYRLRAAATSDTSFCAPAAAAEAKGQSHWRALRRSGQAYPAEATIWADFESMMPAAVCSTP